MSNCVALEESIMQKGCPATAGSKILENFIAPFDAAVVDRLREAGYEIADRASMSEFGLGGMFEDSAEEMMPLNCLCNDLFGHCRREAADNDLCYIHPTYGTVSRYGLIPLASSMDQIGVLCKDMDAGFSLLSTIAGHDPRDGAMFPEKTYSYCKAEKGLTVCAPSHVIENADKPVQDAIHDFAKRFSSVDIALDYFDAYRQTMYALSCAEISSNLSRYDGIKFGWRHPDADDLESLYVKTRTEAFEPETKLTTIMGAMVLSTDCYVPYYEKAMKIRRKIKQSLSFDKYDLLVLPASVSGSHYDNLALYAAPALAGLPSISFTYNGQGLHLIAGAKNENALYSAWEVSRQ